MMDWRALRVALVHDWLTGMRGGERALEVMCELFPQADLYTLVARPERLSPTLAGMRILPSVLQNLPGGVKHYRHYLPLLPWIIRRFRLQGYDLVLSSSHAVAKGARVSPFTPHVCYLHAPLRYMWDSFDEYFGPGRASLPVRLAARALRGPLRRWDWRSAQRVQRFLVAGRNIQEQARRLYGRSATIVGGPVRLERFAPAPRREDFYLMVGAFAPNKRVPLAIEAFNRLGSPLWIVGGGQEEARCRALAGPTIRLLGEVSDEDIASLYGRARAFIFPGVEDFGLTPLEAQASGTPVLAFAAGGALETVTPQTGILYAEPGPEGLMAAVRQFEADPARFTVAACQANAQRFSRERFRANLEQVLEETLTAFRAGGMEALRKWW
ncbi:MAG TPA: glycosyltransferase [bacterium]|nr:glycosyltransferase [bacterium]